MNYVFHLTFLHIAYVCIRVHQARTSERLESPVFQGRAESVQEILIKPNAVFLGNERTLRN